MLFLNNCPAVSVLHGVNAIKFGTCNQYPASVNTGMAIGGILEIVATYNMLQEGHRFYSFREN